MAKVSSGHPPPWISRLATGRKLPIWLAIVATLLVSPSLFIGFHLDDLAHRHMLSSRPGGSELLAAYESPFGIANGDAESIRWQITKGLCPWWTPDDLLISLWRPVSEATHRLDAALWPDTAWPMHAQSLLWFFLLVGAACLLYRAFWGATTLTLVAAGCYAVDHTHGFAVGWIANRNAVIAAFFGVAGLLCYRRSLPEFGATGCERWPRRGLLLRILSLALLSLALLSGEGAVAIMGYIVAHALFVERASTITRALRVLPYLVLLGAWRIAYMMLGRGASGSGLYVDPGREPLHFASAVVERAPLLLHGMFWLPPSEFYVLAEPGLQPVLLGVALASTSALAVFLWPLVRSDREARFWAAGMLASVTLACSTHPNNRLLFFAGLGAFGLIAQAFQGHIEGASWLPGRAVARRLSRWMSALLVGLHLLLSPLLLPVAACSVAFTAPVHRGLDALLAGPSLAGKTVVFLHATDFYQTKLVRSAFALSGRAMPASVYGLSYGRGPLVARRVGARALELHWPRGLWERQVDTLYRDPHHGLFEGQVRRVPGLSVRILAATPQGRPTRARFVFDRPLDDPSLHWLRWDGVAPEALSFRVGQEVRIDSGRAPLGW
ncbi:MAG: hypothetical protein OXR73_21565 [Myxococcales bacterium]|nr:hypothetical protein [Myxococcales bacterium]